MEKRERQLITEFGHTFKQKFPKAQWFKIPDSPTKKQVAKPYDVECTFKAIPIGIEFKYTRSHPRDLTSLLRPSQIAGLTDKVNAGGRGYMAVEIDKTTKDGRKRCLLVMDWKSKLTYEFNYTPHWELAVVGLAQLFVLPSVAPSSPSSPSSLGAPFMEEFDF